MKRVFFTALQVGITVFLLWWIFRDPAKRTQMLEAMQTADYLWLIPGVVSLGCAFLLQTERWRRLLSVQKINLGWWRTFRVYLIGAFFNLFLLGATGGDIVKIYYAMRETASKKSAALLSVMVPSANSRAVDGPRLHHARLAGAHRRRRFRRTFPSRAQTTRPDAHADNHPRTVRRFLHLCA
jgi:uncharacterized membrane protein YbhN (UPF0104 family)